MKVFKTILATSGEMPRKTYRVDTIEYQGKMWIVPEWLETPRQGWKRPARLILLDVIPHQRTLGSPFGDFVLTSPIPRGVYDGTKFEAGYVVLAHSDLTVQIPKGI